MAAAADPAALDQWASLAGPAIETVRRGRLGRFVRPGGQQAQLAIDLKGVGVDDGAAELGGDGKRQRRLAARGRPGDEDGVGVQRPSLSARRRI